jgi:EAL domain-containing protein (putative c-di-GMP-specific phosphodiesterase class I)
MGIGIGMIGVQLSAEFFLPKSPGRADLFRFIEANGEAQIRWSAVHLDIASMRLLNRVLGAAGGDRLLELVGRILADDRRHIWFRLSADVWLGLCERRDLALLGRQVQGLRKTLREAAAAEFGRGVRLDATFGLAAGADLVKVIAVAENACHDAKSNGVAVSMAGDVREAWEESGIVERLLGGETLDGVVQLYRQRIHFLDGRQRFEILSRVRSESVGAAMVMIEQIGMSRDYDLMLLRQALKTVPSDAPQHTVNFSSLTLADSGAVLEAIELLRGRLNIAIEITETGKIHDHSRLQRSVEMLSSAGVAMYLDDFGEGTATLAMIEQPWTAIKLSRRITAMTAPRDVLEALVGLAKARGMDVIAECVETQEHMDYLVDCGVDAIQGYHIHRPEPVCPMALKSSVAI